MTTLSTLVEPGVIVPGGALTLLMLATLAVESVVSAGLTRSCLLYTSDAADEV